MEGDREAEARPDISLPVVEETNVQKDVEFVSIKNEPPTSNSPESKDQDEVDPVLLASLLDMGMGKYVAKKALISTKNKSIDAALAWIAELGAEEMEALCEFSDNESSSTDDLGDDDEEEDVYYKMVFVVNMELHMGVGKVAAQVGHAALGLYRLMMEDMEKYETSMEEWEEFGERKITLRAKNSQELIELQKKAEGLHLPTYLVQDAGLTQIPAGSTTILAIFGDEQAVNEVTGKLKLL
ncbi:hypothetical protein SK128_021266 [Halocaridina rubra]|uniref:peptidyl-tRNA hydrolase n=1 Tax=Halocaridina rubra TaxID=373956 RepID=A0AAN9A575_HALRR